MTEAISRWRWINKRGAFAVVVATKLQATQHKRIKEVKKGVDNQAKMQPG